MRFRFKGILFLFCIVLICNSWLCICPFDFNKEGLCLLEFNYALWLTLSVSSVPIWNLRPRSPKTGICLGTRNGSLRANLLFAAEFCGCHTNSDSEGEVLQILKSRSEPPKMAKALCHYDIRWMEHFGRNTLRTNMYPKQILLCWLEKSTKIWVKPVWQLFCHKIKGEIFQLKMSYLRRMNGTVCT